MRAFVLFGIIVGAVLLSAAVSVAIGAVMAAGDVDPQGFIPPTWAPKPDDMSDADMRAVVDRAYPDLHEGRAS